MCLHLSEIFPVVDAEQIVNQMVPPSTFHAANFSNYIPDPHESSQKNAVEAAENFVKQVNDLQLRKIKFWGKKKPKIGYGLYLDGGFGVGKTHLLASIYSATIGKKAFGSFAEYTQLIGALGFNQTIELLSDYSLICIDEFELDDPGDTMQMSRLLDILVNNGVSIAATSNTLPGQLGEGRFASNDFFREIQKISHIFHSVKVDGPDYRHRQLPPAPEPLSDDAVIKLAQQDPRASLDTFDELIEHLGKVHPAKYKEMLSDISQVCLVGTHLLHNQSDALLLVSLIDRIYDESIPIINSGCNLDKLFDEEMLMGGYRKKYLRAISRLLALNNKNTHQ